MKILTVFEPENTRNALVYSAKVSNSSLEDAVKDAARKLELDMGGPEIADALEYLKNGCSWWYGESFCFCVGEVGFSESAENPFI